MFLPNATGNSSSNIKHLGVWIIFHWVLGKNVFSERSEMQTLWASQLFVNTGKGAQASWYNKVALSWQIICTQ